MKSNVDLYLNADRSKVVLAADPAAASLLVNAGREIPDAEVSAMGAGILEQAQALADGKPPAGAKAMSGPTEDKEQRQAGNKAATAPKE